MHDELLLYTRLAAAYVRGRCGPAQANDAALFELPLDMLDAEQLGALVRIGRAQGLRLHRFKRTMGLPRVAKVLGALKGIAPSVLLDIGSGRGAFLWPLLDTFPWLPITALDNLFFLWPKGRGNAPRRVPTPFRPQCYIRDDS